MEQSLFTADQIQGLRNSYGTLNTMDPCSKSYQSLIGLLDKLPQEFLKQLASEDIKFISKLALNRVRQ